MRQLKALLNKLTVEKFDKIYSQIISAGITEEAQVVQLMKMVFEKAVTQHHYIQVCCVRAEADAATARRNASSDFEFLSAWFLFADVRPTLRQAAQRLQRGLAG